MNRHKHTASRTVVTVILSLLGLCLLAAAATAGMNAAQPKRSEILDHLSAQDKARLAEVFHLRQSLGDEVLPGWAQAEIPVILYNESYLFLVGLDGPADGWFTVPKGRRLGTAWEVTPGDEFLGRPYYRQKLPAGGEDTQAFTVRVGDRWVASLSTLDWTRIILADQVGQQLPAWLQSILPLHLMARGMIPSSDVYVSMILHESLHAYQGMLAGEKLADSENIFGAYRSSYPWEDEVFRAAWQSELDLLNAALLAEDDTEALRLARAFLQQRAGRREAAGLPAALIEMEQLKEWEEGFAKYGELTLYRLAGDENRYRPLAEIGQDPEFKRFQGAQVRWEQQIAQIRREAGVEGDGRFYYSGFAQAALLDRLSPGWQARLFEEGASLEGLLAEATDDKTE